MKKIYFSLPKLGVSVYRSDIGAEDDPYMQRWILRTPLGMLRLHKILRADATEAWHDHPAWLCSFILKGGYEEVQPVVFHDDGFVDVFLDRLNPKKACKGFYARPSDGELRGGPYRLMDGDGDNVRYFSAPAVNFIPVERFHRIGYAENPTWTFVIMGPLKRKWGYLTPEGVFTEYDKAKS